MLNQTSAEDMVLERKKELDKAGNTDGERKNIMCIEVLNSSSIGNTLLHPTLYVHRHFTYFFQTSLFWQHYFRNIVPIIYGINTKRNSWKKVISPPCLEDYKTTLHSFFHKQHFYMPHQAEIWFKIITVSCIKRVLKKKKHYEERHTE